MLVSGCYGGERFGRSSVSVLLAQGAEPLRRTKSGKTPRDLAARMGWPRVEALLFDAERKSAS